jgi:transcriptional regulator with XRE-family HTH domain
MERNICLNWQAFVEEAVKRRKSQRLSQKQLAILAGVSKPVVVNFEHGKTNITLLNALKILQLLGLYEENVV